MKKLMVVAVFAAMGTAFAVESSNIVGYQGIGYRQGFQLGTPTFNAVGNEGMPVKDIVPAGENVTGGGDVFIQILNNLNQTIKRFYYLTDADWGVDDGDGWYEDVNDPSEQTNYVLQPGESYIMSSAVGAIQLTTSGEVKYPKTIDFRKGFQLGGDFLPVNVNIKDLTPKGANVTGGGDVFIQILNNLNQTIKRFYYLTDDDWGVDDGDGWYEDVNDPSEQTNYVLQPGEGFIMSSAVGAIQMEYPELSL